MKKIAFWIIVVVVFFLGASNTYAIRSAKLFDKTYKAPQCLVLCANPEACSDTLCKDLDVINYGFQKTYSQELDIFPSGQIAVFVDRKKGGNEPYGGLDPQKDVVFYPYDGSEPVPVGNGLQVFKRGKVRLNFTQPYDDLYRREMDFRVIVYFYPHMQSDLNTFRQKKLDNNLEQYKIDHKRDISDMCAELSNSSTAPDACVTKKKQTVRKVTQRPELFANQSDSNNHKPLAVLDRDNIYAFTHQPLQVNVTAVEDPDGLCDDFEYLWDTTSGSKLSFVVDDFGNALFTPNYTGEYTVRFRMKEDCVGHSLMSDPSFVKVRVNDRNKLFRDLSPSHPYREFLYDLYALGVVQGYPDGSVKPDKLVSRAEFLKMLFETAQVNVPSTAFSYAFPDVYDGEWYAPYVYYAKNLNIIQGYPDNHFRPTSAVNLAEAFKMMLQITDIELKETLDVWFGDVETTDWYSRYIQSAYREGILDDVEPQQNVYPGRYLTRGEVAKLLIRTFIKPVNRINMVNVNKLR